MFITKKHLSRRTMLKGAGVSLGLPLLDAMIPAGTALADTAAVAAPRMGFVYFPHGAVMSNWVPTQHRHGLQDHADPGAAGSLSAVHDDRQRPAQQGGREPVARTPSSPAPGSTCVHPPGSQQPHVGSVRGPGRRQVHRTGHAAAVDRTGGRGRRWRLRSFLRLRYSGTIAFRTGEQPLPMDNNPRQVFARMFGLGDTAEQRHEITQETGSVLDYVQESAKDMQRNLDPADKRMVSDYLDSVREVERRVQKMMAKEGTGVKLPNAPDGVPDDFAKMLDTMFDMIALGWQSNTTRVASFMIAKEVSMRTYPNLPITDAFHPLSHHQNDPGEAREARRASRTSTPRRSALREAAGGDAGWQRQSAGSLDHSVRQQHEQQRHAQQRSAAERGAWATVTARSRAASTCTTRRTRRTRICC